MPTVVIKAESPAREQELDKLPYGFYLMRLRGASVIIPVVVAYYQSGRNVAVSLGNPKDTWTGVTGAFTPIKTEITINPL